MICRGEIDKLQEAVTKRLVSLGEFAVADISAEGAKLFENGAGKACGVAIVVKIPMPLESSKYAAGPVFSKVGIRILARRDDGIARHSPSMATIAESVTRALHNWSAPIECGYAKLSLSEKNPWEAASKDFSPSTSLIINFTAQSVLE